MVTFVAFVVNDNDRTTTLEISKDRLSVEHYNAINSNRINNKTKQTSDRRRLMFSPPAPITAPTVCIHTHTHISRTVNR